MYQLQSISNSVVIILFVECQLYLHTCVVHYHSFKLDLWVEFRDLFTGFQKQTIALFPVKGKEITHKQYYARFQSVYDPL